MKASTKRVVAGATVIGFMAICPPCRKMGRRWAKTMRRRLRYGQGRLEGVIYRATGRHPNEYVSDDVLADRIRSSLGRLRKQLDLPRVNVMVERGVVLLHGVVRDVGDAEAIEQAVESMPGVRAVESYLHTGMSPGDVPPSQGARHPAPSDAYVRLTEAARAGGAQGTDDVVAVRAVLGSLAEELPAGERQHLLSHLPADVACLAQPPRRRGSRRPRTARGFALLIDELIAEQSDTANAFATPPIIREVFQALRELVPEEVADINAVLPSELKTLWSAPRAAS